MGDASCPQMLGVRRQRLSPWETGFVSFWPEPSDWGLLVVVGMPAAGPAATWGEAVEVHHWNAALRAVSLLFL